MGILRCMAIAFIASVVTAWKMSMRRYSAFLGAAAISLTASIEVHAADLDRGNALFAQSCAGCHAGGSNSFPFAGSKTLSQTDLKTNGYESVDSVVAIIRNGKGPMQAYGEFVSPKGNVIPARFTDEEMKVWH